MVQCSIGRCSVVEQGSSYRSFFGTEHRAQGTGNRAVSEDQGTGVRNERVSRKDLLSDAQVHRGKSMRGVVPEPIK